MATRFDILSIFPEALEGLLSVGVIGQARQAGQIEIHTHDLRNFTDDTHRVVDDRPFGGGAGMVMKVEPFVRAIEAIQGLKPYPLGEGRDANPAHGGPWQETKPDLTCRTILLSAQGTLFRQRDAVRWAAVDRLILLCGRYEGVDERVLEFVDEEVSIGDYVLAGGEAAAIVLIEATARLTPGVVGKYDSVASDSFYGRAGLGAPQYTRPPVFRGLAVPEVLVSGDHAKIEEYRRREAWKKTAKNRPDLLGLRLEADLEADEHDG